MAAKDSAARNVAIGSALQVFEMGTLGIVFDNLKTVMAANRNDTLQVAAMRIYSKGGLLAFYRGLVPWGLTEACTKGGVLYASSNAISKRLEAIGASKEIAGAAGGIGGGVCQAYTTMGFCTFFRTVEISRGKGPRSENVLDTAARIVRTEGVGGMYKGVSAVALRQATNWGSRFFFSRIIERVFKFRGEPDRSLTRPERIGASAIGGGLACWNQPLEVLRVEMQLARDGRTPSLAAAARLVYRDHGLRGFYRGVTPRIALSVYLTVVMVFGGDEVKAYLARRESEK